MKRVLVTGASKGIGKGIALKLGSIGWKVAVHYNSDEQGAIECENALGEAASGIYQADLGDLAAATGLVRQVEMDGSLYALVNNAGIYVPLDFSKSTDEDFLQNIDESIALNFRAPVILSREVIKSFLLRGGGKILNVASRVGFKGEAGASVYAATKAGLINLTRSLAVELAKDNIGVFGIAPGWTETAMVRDNMDERLEGILSTLPLGRMASVQDCAVSAAFLLSEEASYLSGQVIDINGASYFH